MSPIAKAAFKIHIDAPIQTVWEALTREGEVLPFFYNSVFHTPALRAGSALRMRSTDGRFTGVVGDILVVDPPRRFSHTFKFTQFNDAPCRVSYELSEAGGGTDLVMFLDDMPSGTKTEKYMMSGGTFITGTLKSVIETGRPSFGSRCFLAMIGCFSIFTPKACRSENWPFGKNIN